MFFFLASSQTLKQRSPNFLATGTSFVEDNFSTDNEGGRVWVGGGSNGSGGNSSDGD